jgi:hypothetical protein
MSLEERYQQQVKIFERLVDLIVRLMNKFGRHSTLLERGDYSVYDDYWGYPQVKVTVCTFDLLKPSVVKALQSIISKFPGWEIVVALYIRGGGENWPDMGLIIRGHEIIDGLQRQYFPAEYRDLAYEGSRPGTDRD